MNVRQLRALSAVIDTGGVTTAAERLRLTQPAVSRLIRTLEQEVGFPLFDRQKRKLLPTDQAYQFLAEADRILAGLEELTTVARVIRDQQATRLRIIAIPPFTHEILPRALERYRQHNPEVRVHLEVRRGRDIQDRFGGRQFDFAVTGLPFERNDISTRRFAPVAAVAVVRHGDPLADAEAIRLEHLSPGTIIALTSDTNLRTATDNACDQVGMAPDYLAEVSSSATACAMVAAGLGVAVIDPFTARAFASSPDIVMKPISDPVVLMHYGILTVASRPLSPHAQALIGDIERACAAFAHGPVGRS